MRHLQSDDEIQLKKQSDSNLILRLGIMLVVAILIVAFILLFRLVKMLMYRNYAWFRTYMKIHDKIFYNLFIRYIFQSTLKVQFASAMTLMLLDDWSNAKNLA